MARLNIVQQLGSMSDSRATEALIELTRDPSGTVMTAAMLALIKVRLSEDQKQAMIQRFLEVMKGRDPMAGWVAMVSLSRLAREEYVKEASVFLDSKEQVLRLGSAAYLRSARTPEALDKLKEAARAEKDPKVLAEIKKALEDADSDKSSKEEKKPENATAP